MKKVVITGATGMLGLALLEKCISEGVEVIAFTSVGSRRLSRIPKSPLVRIVQCNMEDYSSYELKEEDRNADAFFHFAWGHTSHAGRNDEDSQKICVDQSMDAVELAKKMGVKTFVYAGSQGEYGRVDEPTREDRICAPLNAYGQAKLVAEEKCQALCDEYGMLFLSLRIFSIYGPYIMEFTMVSTAVRKCLNGEQMDLSAGTQMWNFLYQDDFAKMVYLLALNAKESGAYNIGHPDSMPLRDYIAFMKEAMPDFKYTLAAPDENNKPISIEPVMDKTFSVTNYVPETDFVDGIRRMYEYYEKNISTDTSI